VTVTALALASAPLLNWFDGALCRGEGDSVEAGSVTVIVLGIGHTPDVPLPSQAMVNTFDTYRVEVREL